MEILQFWVPKMGTPPMLLNMGGKDKAGNL